MSDSRSTAHEALRQLWEVADKRLSEPDVTERNLGRFIVREVETTLGAKTQSLAGHLSVSAEFEKPDGSDEVINVTFPEDIRDLSESEVRIDWYNDEGMGTNTPPLRDFPKIAQELLALF